MALIDDVAGIAEKWSRVTPQRAADYEAGIKDPTRDWMENTVAANAAYKAGVQEAIAKDFFLKGVKEAGTETWQEAAIALGPARFSQGVALAAPSYEEGFAPYRETILKTVLPPRFAAGDPRNIDRVRVIAAALAAAART